MESVVTKAPGTLEFLPNQPAQHHRLLDGKDFVIAYGPGNRLESFRANNVKTRTEPTAEERRRNRPASTTTSRDLEARFDPKTSRMANMQQSGDFAYEEGDRKARAAKATMDADQNLILLDTAARVWDATGSTAADHIRLDQRTGDFVAEGNVTSSRLPEQDQKKNSEMLSGDDPLQATARKMDSRNRNRQIHYEGAVHMWQGANRIEADMVDVDRDLDPQKRTLVADGHVVTNLWDAPKDDAKKKAATPVLTEVHAGHMVYTEASRLTHYTGGVQLSRPGLRVKGQELRAFLSESGADSRLEKAYADGAVEIFSTGKDRTRTGTGDHAEYYTADQKVILRGSWVRMVEKQFNRPQPSTTEGKEATYFANDDRLLMTGEPEKPGNSRINRKKGK
jgi:lipopolysaccharide export system protein LptA